MVWSRESTSMTNAWDRRETATSEVDSCSQWLKESSASSSANESPCLEPLVANGAGRRWVQA